MLKRLEEAAPFDVVLFVGLSSWLPKPQTLRHLAWLRRNLAEGGLLVTDCFTPEAYALSCQYIGYKANYYTPDVYKAMLDFCGFAGLNAEVESGRDHINHVLVASSGQYRNNHVLVASSGQYRNAVASGHDWQHEPDATALRY